MFHRPPRPPIEQKPTLPLLLDGENTSDGTAESLLISAATVDESLQPPYSSEMGGLFLRAIDPATGDSTLHRAAAIGNSAFMELIVPGFGRQLGQRPAQQRLLWLLITHQNLAGDTALHAAARAGSLRGLKDVFRLYSHDFLKDDPQRGPDSENPHAEYWGPVEDDPEATLPALAFVLTKNHVGHDAATEARAAGHEEAAAWLDALAERLDPEGKRANEEYPRDARGVDLKYHRYYDEENGREPVVPHKSDNIALQ